MRIRNFDLEEPRNEQFFKKLCRDIADRFPAPDLGLEVTSSQLTHANQPVTTLSIVALGLHAYVIMHGPEKGEELEVLILNTKMIGRHLGSDTIVRRLGIKNVRLSQLEIISRMLMDFFLDWSDIGDGKREEIINALYSRIADQADLPLVVYGKHHNKQEGISVRREPA